MYPHDRSPSNQTLACCLLLCPLQLPHVVLELFQRLQPYSISSGYGLFRTMTGVGQYDPQSRGWGDRPASIVARPEIILEGFDGQEWKEIHFRYKPGCTTCRPRFVAPHQPRLDWQVCGLPCIHLLLAKSKFHPWNSLSHRQVGS